MDRPFSVDEMRVALGLDAVPAWKRSPWHRRACAARGHRSPGAMLGIDGDTDPERLSVRLSWICCTCGRTYMRAFSVPMPDCEAARFAVDAKQVEHREELHLDVLHEINVARFRLRLEPLRRLIYPPADSPLIAPALTAILGPALDR